jgi:hypothetical protein
MDAQLHPQQNGPLLPNKFYNKVTQLPIINFGVNQVYGLYDKVKEWNGLTNRSLSLAETVGHVVVERAVTPILSITSKSSLITAPLERMDSLAVKGLEIVEDKVPSIKKEPSQLVSEAKEVVEQGLQKTKARVTAVSDVVLVSRPVQTYFDILEFMLGTASSTLDKVMPPAEDEDDERKKAMVPSAERGWFLLSQFFGLLYKAKTRVVKRVRSRIDSTSNATEKVFEEAKKAVNNAIPLVGGKGNKDQTNGDSKNGSNKTSNKNKKNKEQDDQQQPPQ